MRETPTFAPAKRELPWTTEEIAKRVIQFGEGMTGKKLYPYQYEFALATIMALLDRSNPQKKRNGLTALFARQCIGKDQIVFNQDGSVVRMCESENAWRTYKKRKVFNLKCKGGSEIDRVTMDHVFFTPDGEKRLADLQVNDKIAIVTKVDEWRDDRFLCGFVDLFVNMWRTDIVKVRHTWTLELAEYLGYMTTDGYADAAIRAGQSLKFTNTNADILCRYHDLVSELFPNLEHEGYEKGNGYDVVTTAGKASFQSNDARNLIRVADWDHGFPRCIFNTNARLVGRFLSAVISGDGYFDLPRRAMGIACGNDIVYARYMQALLLKVGVRGTVKPEMMKGGTGLFYRIELGGVENILTFLRAIKGVTGKELRYTELLRTLSSIPKSGSKGVGKGNVAKLVHPEVDRGPDGEVIAWATILEIEEQGEVEVWDREVSGKGWFVCQGVKTHNSGKTEAVAVVADACAVLLPALAKEFPHDSRVAQFHRGFWVGIYAPKDEQAKLAYDRVREYAHGDTAKEIYSDRELELTIETSRADMVSWNSGSKVRARTASPTAKCEGDTWDMVICDESQDLTSDKIDKELLPMLASTKGVIIFIGTTGGAAGYFHRQIKQNVEREREDGNRRHFEADYKRVIQHKRERYDYERQRWNAYISASERAQAKMLEEDPEAGEPPLDFHLNYEGHVFDVEIAKRGGLERAELDETFQLNYMLVWGLDSRIAVPYNAWSKLAVPNLELNNTGIQGFLVAGLDVAKGEGTNADETVLAIEHIDVNRPIVDKMASSLPGQAPLMRYMKTLIGLYTFRGDFEQLQYDGVVSTCRMYPGIVRLAIDSNGIGDPVASRLRAMLPEIEVEGLSWASWANKSMCYKLWLMDVRGGFFRYAAGPNTRAMRIFQDMETQVLALEKKFIGAGNLMVCEAPEGEHDDHPDALAFTAYAAEQAILNDNKPGLPEIECSDHRRSYFAQGTADSGPASRADSYRGGRRGLSRYDVQRYAQ